MCPCVRQKKTLLAGAQAEAQTWNSEQANLLTQTYAQRQMTNALKQMPKERSQKSRTKGPQEFGDLRTPKLLLCDNHVIQLHLKATRK